MRRIGESVRRTTVAPLRRLDEDDISVAQSDVEDAFDDAPVARTPRWIVVSGLIVYCSVFWAFIWIGASWLISVLN